MNSYRQPGIVLTDRRFTVPLDHDDPGGETIELFGREAVAAGRPSEDLPWLVYLEGGPGFGARRFVGAEAWLGRAVREFRVLLLDQRGTGLSTPANRQTLPMRGGPREQADYLAHFRSDSIVRDCELIRPRLTGGAPGPCWGSPSADSAPYAICRPPRKGSQPSSSPAACPHSTRTPTRSTGPHTRGSSGRSPRTTPATRRTSPVPARSPRISPSTAPTAPGTR